MRKVITAVSMWSGTAIAVVIATVSLILYLLVGVAIGFSVSYNMVANTVMSAISFLMLFIIQYSQIRDTKALHLKLDEVVYKMSLADNRLLDAECLTDDELEALALRYASIAETCRKRR